VSALVVPSGLVLAFAVTVARFVVHAALLNCSEYVNEFVRCGSSKSFGQVLPR